jgi:hypothetical protein
MVVISVAAELPDEERCSGDREHPSELRDRGGGIVVRSSLPFAPEGLGAGYVGSISGGVSGAPGSTGGPF